MMFGKVLRRNEEQAVASWINYLNQVRLDRLIEGLNNQEINFSDAINTLVSTMAKINETIIERNRGGLKGMHGFIAEVAECGVGNAREQILGKMPIYKWVNDNGPADLIRDGVEIQQKFVNSGNHLSLQAIKQHYSDYPWFLDGGRKYQIPADHYEKIKYLLSIPEEQANKMPKSNGEFSLKQWKEVHEFFDGEKIKLSDIEPSRFSYKDVQRDQIQETIGLEKNSIKETDEAIRKDLYEKSKATLKQGAQVAAASAALEGGMTFATGIVKKRKSGKKIKEFTTDDWIEISKDSGMGTLKGGIRGITIYELSNYTATSTAVASSLCTASFGIANEAYRYRNGEIIQEEFLLNAEVLCVDATVCALSSIIGQTVIPVPILGAVIGNTVGTFVYEIAKDNLNEKEQKLIKQYVEELQEYNKYLDQKLEAYILKLQEEFRVYYSLLEKAFSPDYSIALEGSIRLAVSLGVSEKELLKNEQETDTYFN
jgi:hypothetical protein